ncbi:MAG: beta-ketoacyl-[acyl-carrier-protein] synthase family protein [Verrucomicrobiota bacterium]
MPTAHRVAITAAGLASPLGLGLAATVPALREGRDCVTPVTAFEVGRTRSKTAGQIDDAALGERLTRRDRRLHPASRMMIAATREVREGDPGFEPELAIVGTTSGGMSFGEAYYRSMVARALPARRARWLANYLPHKPLLDAQQACGFCVPNQIIANACASGTNAIGHAFSLIRAGKQQSVLCGGYDAISELVFVGFDSLQASTAERIRPFDKNRTGLVLGEGAAMLALENWESARRRGAPILAEVTGYGLSTDNHHLTQPHPSGIGPLQAMRRALDSARLSPDQIGYINAHGTATPFNDSTEGLAIAQLFGDHAVPVSSTKSMMGHSLGAAGSIEAVFSLLALRHGFLPPNINYGEPDPQWALDIVANQSRNVRVRRILSNSFGFGGTNASIVLELPDEI